MDDPERIKKMDQIKNFLKDGVKDGEESPNQGSPTLPLNNGNNGNVYKGKVPEGQEINSSVTFEADGDRSGLIKLNLSQSPD